MSRGGGRNPLFASPDATFNRSRSLVPHLQFQFRWTSEGTNVYSMNDDGRMRAPLCAPKSFSGFEENVVVNPRRTSFGANQDPRGDHLRAIRGRWRKTRPSANRAEAGRDVRDFNGTPQQFVTNKGLSRSVSAAVGDKGQLLNVTFSSASQPTNQRTPP